VGAAAHVCTLAICFLIVLAGTAFLITFVAAWLNGTQVTDGASLQIGVVCGLIAWLIIAVFHFRKETIALPFLERGPFLVQMKRALADLGYELESEGDVLGFKPKFRSYLLGGGVRVRIEGNAGKITGPKVPLEILRRRMRIRNHLDNIPQAIQEGRRRQGERLLKRVHVSLRFSSEQWQDVYAHLVQPLAREGTVVCDLNVLVQNDAGMPDRMLDLQVRPWLQSRNIAAEIHKTPLYEPCKPSDPEFILPHAELVR